MKAGSLRHVSGISVSSAARSGLSGRLSRGSTRPPRDESELAGYDGKATSRGSFTPPASARPEEGVLVRRRPPCDIRGLVGAVHPRRRTCRRLRRESRRRPARAPSRALPKSGFPRRSCSRPEPGPRAHAPSSELAELPGGTWPPARRRRSSSRCAVQVRSAPGSWTSRTRLRRRSPRARRPRSPRVARTRARTASRPPRRSGARHLGNPVGRDDLSGDERRPQRADVGRRRVDPAVAAAPYRQMEHVGAQAVSRVTDRCASRQLVRAEEVGVAHPGRLAHAFVARVRETACRSLVLRPARARRSRRCSTRSSSPAANFFGCPARIGDVLLGRRRAGAPAPA